MLLQICLCGNNRDEHDSEIKNHRLYLFLATTKLHSVLSKTCSFRKGKSKSKQLGCNTKVNGH